jgi:hypothetical protein
MGNLKCLNLRRSKEERSIFYEGEAMKGKKTKLSKLKIKMTIINNPPPKKKGKLGK